MRNEIDYLGQSYTDDDIAQGQGHLQKSESLNMERLAVNTFDFQIASGSDLTGFSQNSPVAYKHRGNQMLTAYLQTVDRVGVSRYSLSAISSIGRLTQRRHFGGIYTGQTAQAVISDICGTIPVYIEPVFRDIALYGWLPIDWARNNLARVLFAISANVRTDENGVIRVINLPTSAQSVITADNVYMQGASARVDSPVTSVTVLEHQYIPQAGTEPDTLFEGVTVAGQRIEFSGPMFDLVADGFTITESGANYAIVGAGNGTLTGKAYTHVTRAITRAVTTAPIPNEERYEDCGLVGLTNSATVADRLAEYHRHRETINLDAITTFEQPGDVVSLYHPYLRQQVNACIFDASTILSGVLKSSISALVGFTPWQTVEFEDVRVVLTGSGTWTPEEGVTSVTAVLIGGGSGGNKGGDGANGTRYTYSGTVSSSFSVRNGTGGEGGVGGQGGSGGNVLRVDMSIQSQAGIQYAVGAAGVGGEIGTAGGATTFGAYSSADGSASAVGYTDPVTGEVFASAGANGLNGGKGGDGGSAGSGYANDGEAGGDVGTHVGGQGGGSDYDDEEHYQKWGTMFNVAGGGGGGAGNNGDGGNGTMATEGGNQTLVGGAGGDGGSASVPAAKTVYGTGGDGGGGGGGGGGTAGVYYRRKDTSTSLRVSYYPHAGVGGSGANGGDGAPGCIILTYRRPVTT